MDEASNEYERKVYGALDLIGKVGGVWDWFYLLTLLVCTFFCQT